MFNFQQQQQPGMFPAIDALEPRVHGVVPYVLGACGAVGGYFWGRNQATLPVALCVALGLVVGLLLVPLILGVVKLALAVMIVAAAAVLMFWLLNNDAAMKQQPPVPSMTPAPAPLPAPAKKARDFLSDLFPGVR